MLRDFLSVLVLSALAAVLGLGFLLWGLPGEVTDPTHTDSTPVQAEETRHDLAE